MIINTTFTIIAIIISYWVFKNTYRRVFTVWEHKTTLHFIHGKLIGILEPGKHTLWGIGHTIKTMENRLQHIIIQSQDIPASDGITVKTSVVGLYKIQDAVKAFQTSTDPASALHTLIQLALRDIISTSDTEELLKSRGQLGFILMEKITQGATSLGLTVSELAVRDIILPGEIKRAITATMQAKQNAQAELEIARGRAAALRILANSTKQFDSNPGLLKLRYIEALEKAADGNGNTFVIGQSDPSLYS